MVCTSSLDLGVDFAPVDTVLQVGSLKGAARLLQRTGRSGHRPGAESRVTCVPTNAFELVEVAADPEYRRVIERNRLYVVEDRRIAQLHRMSIGRTLFERTGTQRMIVLGDLLHARTGRSPATLSAMRPGAPPVPGSRSCSCAAILAGHLHPAARLTGPGGQGLRLPCFWFQPHGAVLPAFGSFTGTASIAPRPATGSS